MLIVDCNNKMSELIENVEKRATLIDKLSELKKSCNEDEQMILDIFVSKNFKFNIASLLLQQYPKMTGRQITKILRVSGFE